MQITFLTYGSQGDVQPFVALGMRLQQAGHTIMLAAPERFAAQAQAHGFEFVGLPGDITTISRALAGQSGTNQLRFVAALYRHVVPLARQVFHQLRLACRDSDLIAHSFLMTYAGHMLAQERGIPDLSVQLFPMFAPTVYFPGMLAATGNFSPLLNFASHVVATAIFTTSQRLSYQWLRRSDPTLGPPKLRWPDLGRRTPLLFAFSPTLVPPPPDWGPLCTVTGAWHLPERPYTPPPELTRFLADGPPPIAIGMGSMMPPDPTRLTAIILEALQHTGRRGVLLRGWSDLGQGVLPPNAIALDATPHDWLFPQMAGVIHHGGAGTTHAALRSGVPSVALPFGADQPFWAARAHRLGVGPPPVPGRKLTVATLVETLNAFVSPSMYARAAEVGKRLQAEDGVSVAAQIMTAIYNG